MESDDLILTASEAAEFLKIHVETLRRLARKGEVPAFKVGKDWRFRRKSLIQWADRPVVPGRPACVLVIDDDEQVRKVAARILTREGLRVVVADGGREGLECLDRENVGLILLDLKMPGMSGPEFLRGMRARNRRVPVIIVTGYPDSDLMARALAFGPFTLIAKPLEREAFVNTVTAALAAWGPSRPGL